ncbi:MAG: hypothetical protein IT254_07155 [Chitinophagaceae bacterium]|nr:hypothetical protein [Chitinophagaceae bacterium]
MPRVEFKTTITNIIKDGKHRPESPIFRFVNTGSAEAFINNNFRIRPGNDFGIDTTALVAQMLLKGHTVENSTQFDITFDNSNYLKMVQLVQTFVKIIP